MKRPYQLMAIVCIVIAGVVARESVELRYFTSLGPGPGFFPLWLALLFAALAVTMLWQATIGRPEPLPAGFLPGRDGCLRIGAIVAALFGVAVLLNPLGFRPTMLAFNLVLIPLLGRRGWIETGLVAVAGSFGVYHVFVDFLKIPLPIGRLGI